MRCQILIKAIATWGAIRTSLDEPDMNCDGRRHSSQDQLEERNVSYASVSRFNMKMNNRTRERERERVCHGDGEMHCVMITLHGCVQ